MTALEAANIHASDLDLGTDDEVVMEAAQLVRSGEAARDPKTAILLENFRRIYPARGNAPPKVAVDGVDLSIQFGECFGLLGPNGAGKTTLLETLSGLAVPQGGKAFVGGIDMSKDIKQALAVIGVCPQFDVVWNDLSVMNHLLLYARLKGIPRAQQRAAANLAAIKVGLDGDAIGLAASELSGGMRRRLSIAASLVGDPSIVILDEPTTGLDPDTRRQIWAILQKEKRPDRTIIITTHSMEEADTLCTRIGIMAQGKLRALGNQQRLKARYGTGFKLDLVVQPGAAKPDTFVQSLCARASTGVQVGSTVSYSLPRGSFDAAAALAALQHHSSKNGIDEWSLAQPSLEEVFVNLAHRYASD